MKPIQHPIRNAELRIFKCIDSEEHVARFYPYDTYPIIFTAQSEAAVRETAEAFRADVIAKNEAQYIIRKEASERMKAAKTKKPAPEGDFEELLA